MKRVAVCICTFKREGMLDDLLASLSEADDGDFLLDIMIADNDPLASARPVAERYTDRLNVSYVVESTRSISAIRNTSVRVALESNAELVAFLDDDQRVHPSWLRELVAAADRENADAVAGPVVPVFEVNAPRWVRDGGFFSRPRHATGMKIRPSGIANVMVSSRVLRGIKDPFGRHFGRPGGEDTYFLSQLAEAAGEPLWCDEAVVYEVVPADRASVRWLLLRHLRFGRNYSECLRLQRPPLTRLAVRGLVCCGRIAQGLVSIPILGLRGRSGFVRTAGRVLSGVGGLVGLGTSIQ